MKIRMTLALLVATAFLALPRASEDNPSQTAVAQTLMAYDLPPLADAGRDFITYVGLSTRFRGYGATPDGEIVRYEWDFDGDGAPDFLPTKTGLASYVYRWPGTYRAVLSVRDAQGNVATDAVRVTVKIGWGKQAYSPSVKVKTIQTATVEAQGDGLVERYAVMINGASEIRFWNDVTFMYGYSLKLG